MTSEQPAKSLLSRLTGASSEGPRAIDPALPRSGHIDLKKHNGQRIGFAYAHVLWFFFNGRDLLQIHLSTHTVSLKGRNLKRLYEDFLAHRVHEVQEVSERHDDGIGDDPVVTKISAQPKGAALEELPIQGDPDVDKPKNHDAATE